MPARVDPIVVSGSYGEGGSALFRTALSLSALTSQPVRINNVRGALRKNGITSEDLAFVHALEIVCAAQLEGAEVGSHDLTFVPTRSPRGLSHRFDIHEFEKGTVPGNALAVLQSLVPVLARSGVMSKAIVQGETYNANALTFDAFERVTLAAHQRQGIYVSAHQAMAGFGYGAKGEVSIEVEPSVPEGLEWRERANLIGATAIIAHAMVRDGVAERGLAAAEAFLSEIDPSPALEAIGVRAREPGVFVTLLVEYEQGMGVGTAMGQRGVKIEEVVEQAYTRLRTWHDTDATVDPFLADQLLVTASLAEEPTVYRTNAITPRLQTMAWVIKQFKPIHITILGRPGEPGTVTVSP